MGQGSELPGFEFHGWDLHPTFPSSLVSRIKRLKTAVKAVRQRVIPETFYT
jgi:uncharacterized alpha-E superfamily protein